MATDNAFAVASVLALLCFGGMMAENNAVGCSPYIPTTTATVTVNKDDMKVAALGAWFNANAGTMVLSGVRGSPASSVNLMSFNDGTAGERTLLWLASGNNPNLAVVDGGVSQAALTSSAVADSTPFKMAAAYALNDFALSKDGAAVTTDLLGTLPTPTQLEIGQEVGAGQPASGIQTIVYYTSRQPNTALVGLSV
jgi:hypothetical protein